MSSWAEDQIVFSQKSLGDICRFLAKWYQIQIVIDPLLKDSYHYTFTLRNESLEEILRIMSRINPIEYTFDEKIDCSYPPKNELKIVVKEYLSINL